MKGHIKKDRSDRGITLVALVITVVVMLILAGVTISAFVMNGGILDRFKTAVNVYNAGKESEKEQIDELQKELSKYFIDKWDGITVAENFESGNGTKEDPYLIKTAPQLIYFREQVNSGNSFDGEYIKLGVNIELNPNNYKMDSNNNIVFNENAVQWIPISLDYSKTFKGNFDGNNYTISGIYIDDTSKNNQALFGTNNGVIENLNIENSRVKGYNLSALVVGDNNGIISNIVTRNSNVIGYNYIAGICAKNQNTISECINYATISFYKPENETEDLWGWRAGGICGHQGGAESNISKCINYGYIEGTHNTGGILGASGNGNVSLCVNYGTVKAYLSGRDGQSGGGIIGYATGAGGSLLIDNSYNVGEIKKETDIVLIGGVVGLTGGYDNSNITFRNCYSIGKVENNGNSGAFLGNYISNAENCVVNFENCYWTSSSGVEYSTLDESFREQIIMIDNYEELAEKLGAEFMYDKEKGYPVLKWQLDSKK